MKANSPLGGFKAERFEDLKVFTQSRTPDGGHGAQAGSFLETAPRILHASECRG